MLAGPKRQKAWDRLLIRKAPMGKPNTMREGKHDQYQRKLQNREPILNPRVPMVLKHSTTLMGGIVVIGLGDCEPNYVTCDAVSIDLAGDAALEEFVHEPNPNDGNGARGDDGDHLQEVDDDGDAALEEFVHEPNPNDSNGAGGDGGDHLREGDDDSDDDPDYKMVDVIRRPWNTHDFFGVGSLDLSGYNAAWQLDNGVRLLLVGKGEIENIYTPGLCEYIIKHYAKGTNEEIKIFEVSYDEVLENLGKIVAEDNLIFDQKEEENDMDLVVWMYRRTYDGVDHKIGYANPWKYATEQRLIERVYDVLIEDGAVAGYLHILINTILHSTCGGVVMNI